MSMDLFDTYARAYEARRETLMSVAEYLEGCRSDPLMYAGPHERLLAAIGEPEMIDTSMDGRLGRIFTSHAAPCGSSFNFSGDWASTPLTSVTSPETGE